MKISIFGLGYVGAVSAGCLTNDGHTVIGVDPNITKVDLINSGQSPIIEKDLAGLIKKGAESSLLTATTDVAAAIKNTQMSIVCVGTPSQANGSLELKYVRSVCEEIGSCIKEKDGYHIVVMRSTMLPGTMHDVVIPILASSSGKKPGKDFGVCNNPEFLRESTAVYDYYNPPKTVIGEIDKASGDALADIYCGLDAPLIRTDVETAELVKYADNTWHALKVGFANEIGNICKKLAIDSHKVMDIFCLDKKLNLSAYYLKSGFAFGGSCLPKDVRALNYKAKELDLDLPIIKSILPSNQLQIEAGIKMVVDKGNKKVGVLGFSFKAGTDDLRESPMVAVIEHLIGKGYDLKVYDANVKMASIMGANKDYILNHIPHISSLMVESVDEILDHSETILIGNNSDEFHGILDKITNKQVVVDLARISDTKSQEGRYDGICW